MNRVGLMKKVFISLLFCFAFISCTTTAPVKTKAVLIEHPERFFWELKNSAGSVYILGTIHFADKTFYPLEEKVLNAFDSADTLVSELGGKDELLAVVVKLQERMIKNINREPEKNLAVFLSESEIEFLYENLGKKTAESMFVFNPWILNIVLGELVSQEAKLNPADGIDLYLINRAQDRKIEALETADRQLDVLSAGTFEEQLQVLRGSIRDLHDTNTAVSLIRTLRELYLNNDKEGLSKFIFEKSTLPSGVSEEYKRHYINLLFTERNIEWADKIDNYLKKDGTTFIFAGAGHFLGEHSVFEIMKQKGLLEI
ncbi:TraB/GumN family protein [Treponema sp. OMZ 840]|uniref:TraB/GumN family protein n=1 Tax=Treponema sp. OMZ 840 TaxID=244313 RepID=UPI003D906CC7